MNRGNAFYSPVFYLWGVLGLALLVSGCAKREEMLAGKRFDLRSDLGEIRAAVQSEDEMDLPPDKETFGQRKEIKGNAPIKLARPVLNTDWPQRGGNSAHRSKNLALGDDIAPLWAISIGKGNSLRHRIVSTPIIHGGRIFTLDTGFSVKAHDLSGKLLWSRSILPIGEDKIDVSVGTLSYAKGRLFATTGFGDVVALAEKDGKELWRQDLGGIALGPATPSAGLLYLSSANGFGWALETKDGRILWTQKGAPARELRIGASGPTIAGRLVIFAYGEAQIIAALKKSGIVIWQSSVSERRLGRAYAEIALIGADPVFDGHRVYIGSSAGSLVAFDGLSGERLWSTNEGVVDTFWVEGGALFAISDQSQLLRLNAKTGDVVWVRSLPLFKNKRHRMRKKIFGHYGPIMANGKLWIGSEDAGLTAYEPKTGAQIKTYQIAGGAASAPIVAGGRLYVISTRGVLHAFR